MKANLGTITIDYSTVITTIHPPVIKTMEALPDNGILPMGTLVAKDGDGLLAAYDPDDLGTLKTCVGVLTRELDTATDDAAPVIVHGTVVLELLKVGDGALDADDLAALEALGIYAA
jgi:hypothetical protein